MGETGKKKRPGKTYTTANKNTARRRHASRARRRRAARNRRILLGVIAALAVAAVVLVAVAAVRNTRKRKAEEEAAAALAATDVMDMPFSAGSAQTAEDDVASSVTPDGTAAQSTDTTEDAAGAKTVHVEGVDAFSLYRYDESTGMRVQCARYESAWTRGEDIVSLEVFASDSENIVIAGGGGRSWYDAWRTYWQQETGSENCRIGYDVSFDLKNGEHIHAVLLKPGDELFYRPYLENYLYDDAANADAGWYSHLEPDDLSDTMLLTSIKFTPGERFEEIDGLITVTGFVYDAVEDFDYDGNYIGDVLFTTEIVNGQAS